MRSLDAEIANLVGDELGTNPDMLAALPGMVAFRPSGDGIDVSINDGHSRVGWSIEGNGTLFSVESGPHDPEETIDPKGRPTDSLDAQVAWLKSLEDGYDGPRSRAPTLRAIAALGKMSIEPIHDGGVHVRYYGELELEITISPDARIRHSLVTLPLARQKPRSNETLGNS